MSHPGKDEDAKPLRAVGRVLDSRWMMALAVGAVLVAIIWALFDKGLNSRDGVHARNQAPAATVELLGVPVGATVLLDGRRIENTRFSVSPGTRHMLEATDADGRSWRQVFLADGSLSLVVELRTYFVEVEVSPTDRKSED